MTKALQFVLPLLALGFLVSGCGVPLPAPELTATAESGAFLPQQDERGGGQVQSVSSGAPSGSALSLEPTPAEGEPASVLAPLEDDELSGTTVVGEATPVPSETEEPTPDTVDAALVSEDPTTEASAAEEPTATPEPEIDSSLYPSELLTLLNEYRLEHEIPALQFDATLTAAAMAYAEYMATTGYFGHYPPDGSTPSGRIAAAGFGGQYMGEALSAGQTTPAVALSRLLGSSRHAAILLNERSVVVGIGYFYNPNSKYKHYWVVITAIP